MKSDKWGWIAFAVVALWVLARGGGGSSVTSIITGYSPIARDYDSHSLRTGDPDGTRTTIVPFDSGGNNNPNDFQCADGYTLWHDTATGRYSCVRN